MLTLRKSAERGHAPHGWLDSHHTFSFGDYYDAGHMGFRNLRVINEDRVEPGRGFGAHQHRDMEIISYVLDGALAHRDSMNNGSVIRPGDVQRMSAGTGVTHSEQNPSQNEPVHFLQIWLLPAKRGAPPGYEQKSFSDVEKSGRLKLIVSPDGHDGSVTVHSDARIYAGRFERGEQADLVLDPGRHAWVQLARGSAKVNGHELSAGDGAALSGEERVLIEGIDASEVLVFDLG
jgi:quercetin 2,3-dioxygenase